jgi:amino acid adenylation domain-containing protein
MMPPGVQDAYELSPVQQGMLFQTRMDPGAGVYLVQLWTRLSGPLDAGGFRAAWAWALERHAALRTGFVYETLSTPAQVVHKQVDVPLETEDWWGADEAETERRIGERVRAERARGFDLARPPLLRLVLARVSAEEHVLIWTLHHLVLDGWSHTTVLREVLARYDAIVRGTAFDPPAPRPYRDFILWLRGRDRGAAEAFWRDALAGIREPTPLGIDGGRQGTAGADFADHSRLLSVEATAALAETARAHRVTVATVVQGAWAQVLARYAGTDDVVFGWTGAGRPEELPGAERICGLFVNTLPARVRVPRGAALGGWLRGLQEARLAAREHEHVPLVDVQGWSEVPRGQPLFESLLAFENFPRVDGGAATGGLTVGAPRGVSSTGYPLTLVVHPGERMHLRAYTDRARIEDAAAERLLGHLETALRAMASASAHAPLESIDILPAEERATLLAWAHTPGRDAAETALALLEAQAARTPEGAALVFGDESVTYAELHARANRLANHLRALGAGPDRRVCVCLERTPELVVALLATLKSGAAYVPLDPVYPAERIDHVARDSGAGIVVTSAALQTRLHPAEGVRTVRVDADAAEIAARPATAPRIDLHPENLAHILYTSGSTGRPKGVMIRHGSVAALLRWMHGAFPLSPGERVAGATSVSFDVSVAEIHFALSRGGTLVLLQDAMALAEAGAMAGAAQASMVAGTAAELLRLGRLPGTLRRLNLGGEALAPDLARALYAAGTPEVNDLYGPTEDTTYSTLARVAPDVVRGTLGRSIAGKTAYVLDGRMRPAPVGVPGEIWLAGCGLARGYLDRPGMTAASFVPDPHAREAGARMYRTGDRGRWMEGGTLEYLGRADFQVKIRGFRIDPREVEAVLREHPAVDDAAVMARPGPDGAPRLLAWVTAEGEAHAGASELRAHLARRLPDWMVPAAFVAMDDFPRTPSGKLDRRALPEPAPADERAEYTPPSTPGEELLAAIWAEVLCRERVGVHDDFFALGGHSLLGMRVVARVRKDLGVEVPLRTLFDRPTVAAMAAALATAERTRHAPMAGSRARYMTTTEPSANAAEGLVATISGDG